MPRARVKKQDSESVPVSSAPAQAHASHSQSAPKSRARQKADTKQATETHLSVFEWIHQHTLEAIHLLSYHQTVLARLSVVPLYTLPNLLFYGSVGFPLEYMAYALLASQPPAASALPPIPPHAPQPPAASQAPQSAVKPPPKRECLWENKVPYCECESFFEVQCRHPDLSKDYGVLCEFLKAILHTRAFHQAKHVFILRDIDVIAKTEHHYALRVLLERYSANVLFIGTTHALSAIEAPLRSRFMMIRTPQPTPEDTVRLAQHFGAETGAVEERKTLMELLYGFRAAPPEDPQHLRAFLTQSPPPSLTDLRFYAYRCFQKGMPFAYFCRLLIQQAPRMKHPTRLLHELSQLEYTLSQSSKGREPIYYERALYITLFANSIWK